MRPQRVADVIAQSLRSKILSGELKEGDRIPRQEVLIHEYQAGLTSVREALRILELEGTIAIQRGNKGGAIVRIPTAQRAAYMLGVVLQSQQTPISEVGRATQLLEPVCARLCAERPDRQTTVIPKLEQQATLGWEAVDGDPRRCNTILREFHRVLAEGCGNRPLALVAGALALVWSTHERNLTERLGDGGFPDKPALQSVCRAHDALLDAIRDGDGGQAEDLCRKHLVAAQRYHFEMASDDLVMASLMGDAAVSLG